MNTNKTIDKLLQWASAAFYYEQQSGAAARRPGAVPKPFITISRQAGAKGRSLAARLMACLNLADPGEHPWTVWDRELVEKVADECDISPALIESIEGPRRTWFSDLIETWTDHEHGHYVSELQVYRRVAATIRALATAGRAIIVGRGSVYATSDLPGGIHLRLVAPLESRILHMAGELKVCPQQAADWIKRMDRDREEFHRRYFPGKALLPEIFTLTLNSQQLSHEQMLACVLPLIAIDHDHSPQLSAV